MTSETETTYPDIRDPRVMVAVPRERRAAIAALWALAERLTKLLHDAREPLIGQIKLAWWRDMMTMLASDPGALPKGEPLLAELQATWAGQGGLDTLVDAGEAMLLAEDAAARRDAAGGFGDALFALSGGGGGARWGLVWGAMLQDGEQEGRQLFADARNRSAPPRVSFGGNRASVMLDRWAAAIARHDGERRWRGEGLLLLRLGLIGR
jgi:phytoene synthase